MEKIVIRGVLISIFVTTAIVAQRPTLLEKSCLSCHIEQKIPSELIYRRYLLTYSTNRKIKEVLFSYLKNPKKEQSIMPKQFFLKFPEKKALDLNDTLLKETIDAYLNYFDVKEKLVLP
jgi:hypothetical protein